MRQESPVVLVKVADKRGIPIETPDPAIGASSQHSDGEGKRFPLAAVKEPTGTPWPTHDALHAVEHNDGLSFGSLPHSRNVKGGVGTAARERRCGVSEAG